MARFHYLAVLLVFAFVSFPVCHGVDLELTQKDYESKSHSALLQSIRKFQIEPTDLFSEIETVEDLPKDISFEDESTDLKTCKCTGGTCGCCMKIHMKKIHLKLDVCLKFTYLPKTMGVEAQLTVNGKVLFKKTFTAKDPPPFCAPVPGLKIAGVSVCLRFYNMNITTKGLSGCSELQVKLRNVVAQKVKLGCFKSSSSVEDVSSDLQDAIVESLNQFQINDGDLPAEILTEDVDIESADNLKSCSCHGTSCGCCVKVNIKKIHLKGTVCLDVAYLPSAIGIKVALTLNGKTIISKEISAKNPPPICVGVPGMGKMAGLCIHFSNLHINGPHLSGCVALEAKFLGKTIESIKIGCFTIPPTVDNSRLDNSLVEVAGSQTQIHNMPLSMSIKPNGKVTPEIQQKPGECLCQNDICQCCKQVNVAEINLDSKVCISASLLPSKIGIEATLAVDGQLLLKENVAAKDPSPVCAPFNGFNQLCVHFSDLTITGRALAGCGKLTVVASVPGKPTNVQQFGCFQMQPRDEDIRIEIERLIAKAFFKSLLEEEGGKAKAFLMFDDADDLYAASCKSDQTSFSCCVSFKVLSYKQSACVNIVFIPNHIGFDIQLTIDGKVIIHQKIEVKDPPPLCVPVSFISKSLTACVKFSNLSLQKNGVSGCVALSAKYKGRTVKSFKLGCFKLPPNHVELKFINEDV